MYILIGCICLSAFFGKEGISSFIYSYINDYIGHMFIHDELFYFTPYSILHQQHHKNNSTITYLLNILSDFSMPSFMLLPKFFGIPINPWSVLFNSIIYTSVHYINYTIFHVNPYHEKHHIQMNTNYSPAILDSIFDTKHVDSRLENTLHMIPNMIVAFILTFWLKKQYSSTWDPYLYCLWTILFIILSAYSAFILDSSFAS